MIGLNPGAVAIDDAEAIGVAVGGQAGGGAGIENRFAQRREIFFRNVGAGAVEQAVAIEAHGLHGDSVARQHAIEITGAAAMQGIDDKFRFAFAQHVEAHQLFDSLQIIFTKIDQLVRDSSCRRDPYR